MVQLSYQTRAKSSFDNAEPKHFHCADWENFTQGDVDEIDTSLKKCFDFGKLLFSKRQLK